MPRPPDPAIRARLLDSAVDYVLAHGLTDLSLRPLAAELGTSARMLSYHFGSREGLMTAILMGLREREDARIGRWFAARDRPRTLPDFLRWYWRRISAPAARPALLLIFELYALALRSPKDYPGVLGDPVDYWRNLVQRAGIEPNLDVPTATLMLAVLRGLLLDLAATGDRARTTRAMHLLAQRVESRK